jgi:hypothetical protein
MRAATRSAIERATVRLPRRGGQGVLVPGRLIVTAAHVIGWTAEGEMAYGDDFAEGITGADETSMQVGVRAVEPVSDIAVLGGLDDQEALKHVEAFEAFCGRTKPVALCTDDFPLFDPIRVHIFTHVGLWIEGVAQQCAVNASTLAIESQEDIQGGTSGGPVVTDTGLLLGIVSWAGGVDGASRTVCIPRVHLTAPGWLVRTMVDPRWEIRAARMEQRRRMKAK